MNPHRFFVTGMPRSRTAWLANWLTTDQSICYHDLMDADIQELWARNGGKYIGLAGPEVCLEFEKHTDCPWLVVLRDIEQALPSFTRIAMERINTDEATIQQFWMERLELLKSIVPRENVMAVKFEDLNKEETARMIWAHLLPAVAFDFERWKMLSGLNVQQDIWGRKAESWHLAQ